MTTAVAIQPAMPRPTPVAIAAARPKKQHKPSPGKEDHVAGKPVSSAVGSVANIRTRRERPCDACRRRKSRCVIHEGAVLCVLCEFHKQECTFVQSPLPRKRKVVDGEKKDSPSAQKKRYVWTLTAHSLSPIQGPGPTCTHVAHGPAAAVETRGLCWISCPSEHHSCVCRYLDREGSSISAIACLIAEGPANRKLASRLMQSRPH